VLGIGAASFLGLFFQKDIADSPTRIFLAGNTIKKSQTPLLWNLGFTILKLKKI
jgi:hypothetical protein